MISAILGALLVFSTVFFIYKMSKAGMYIVELENLVVYQTQILKTYEDEYTKTVNLLREVVNGVDGAHTAVNQYLSNTEKN